MQNVYERAFLTLFQWMSPDISIKIVVENVKGMFFFFFFVETIKCKVL